MSSSISSSDSLGSVPGVVGEFQRRGLVHDVTEALPQRLKTSATTFYFGADPTADSLHVGNLVGLIAARRLQMHGHKPIVLVGGGTGMIGDPSGKSDERNLLSEQTLAKNVEGVSKQLRQFLDFEPGATQAQFVNNAEWLGSIKLVEFLRDVGKHFTVNTMVAKESVRSRMAGDTGISFTEFSYMLLQAFDFEELFRRLGCELQIGGSDQWGNITAGIDLIRRRNSATAHGLTWPLITRSDGKKYGKTEQGTVWLSADKTSPYAFYQYWINLPDADVDASLKTFTFLELDEINEVASQHQRRPEERLGQTRLADELTRLVHGATALGAARAASQVLFGSDPLAAAAEGFEALEGELPLARLSFEDFNTQRVSDLFVAVGLAKSNGEARRLGAQGGLSANGTPVDADDAASHLLLAHGSWILLRRGKKHYGLIRVA